MGVSNGGLGGVYGGGGSQPEPPSGYGTPGFDVMPRQIPAALGNFGPKSGPANNPGGGWSGGVAAPTPIARPNPIGGQIPGYTPPPGWGDLPTDGGGERPMAPPSTGYPPPTTHYPEPSTGYPPPTTHYPEPTTVYPPPKTGPGASPGIPQPVSPIAGPGHAPGGGGVGIPQPMPPTGPSGVWAGGQVAGPGTPQPMPPTTGPGVGPISGYPGDPTPPGTGGSSGGNVTGPRPSLRPMPQPKMPRRTDVSFYRPPQTLQPQPAKDPTGGATDGRRTAPIYVRPKFK